MEESFLERECRRVVHDLGGFTRKQDVGPRAKGWPDMAIWLPGGLHVIVEFKTHVGVLSPMQEARKTEFERVGFEVHVIRCLADFKRLMKKLGATT